MARVAFRLQMGMRPIAESDAKLLTQWESWNRSAYFMLSERSVFIGNEYEREMDAIHPRPYENEIMLLRKSGEPIGLLKVRPELQPGLAEGFVYFHDTKDYAADGFRKSFRTILKEAGAQQSIKRLMVPAATWEEELQAFLRAVGFQEEGTLRESLYTRGDYHDVKLFSVTPEAL